MNVMRQQLIVTFESVLTLSVKLPTNLHIHTHHTHKVHTTEAFTLLPVDEKIHISFNNTSERLWYTM